MLIDDSFMPNEEILITFRHTYQVFFLENIPEYVQECIILFISFIFVAKYIFAGELPCLFENLGLIMF